MSLLREGRWRPEVREGLQRMVQHEGRQGPGYDPACPPIAAFDWDDTCIHGDIGEAVLDALDATQPGLRARYETLLADAGKRVAYAWLPTLFGGLGEHEALALSEAVLEASLACGRIALRPEMRDLMGVMAAHGWQVWVVSASVEEAVRVCATRYGLPTGRVVGMRLARDEAGLLQPELEGPVTYREGKVEALLRHAGRPPTFAAGDAETDLELLHAARYRLLLDRGEPLLREAARAGGWWVEPAWPA